MFRVGYVKELYTIQINKIKQLQMLNLSEVKSVNEKKNVTTLYS